MPSEDSLFDSRDNSLEFIFLGTGTSSSLPHIECLTAGPDEPPCKTCLSTLRPDGKKNIRRNTSGLFRVKGRDGKKATIVIDVGKNFQAAALEWFPQYGLRRIDAVLITHAHADAMNGLDDLRGWTLNGTIQPYIDIYTSQTTFTEVQRSFPYLVSREFASGGGDVPEFKWHIIEDRIPFEIGETGIRVTPIAVHHGRIFSQAPPPGNLPTPEYTAPSTPISGRSSPLPPTFPITHDHISDFHPTPTLKKIQPYLCFGFKIEEAIVYISDVSYIPEDAWSYLLAPRRLGGAEYSSPVFIVDCLRLNPHTSHFGLGQSIAAVRRLAARRSYLTGFGHEVSHGEYETILRAVGSELDQVQAGASDTESENVRKGLELVGTGEPSGLWVRPAFDGLRIVVHPDGTVEDDAY